MRLAFNARLCKAGNKRRILVRNDYRSLLRTEYSITALQRGYILMVGRFSVGERPKRVFVVNQPPYPLSALARASIPSGLTNDVAIDARLAPRRRGTLITCCNRITFGRKGGMKGLRSSPPAGYGFPFSPVNAHTVLGSFCFCLSTRCECRYCYLS